MTLLRKFLKEEEGLELVEYAVMTALIVVAIVGAVSLLAGTMGARFTLIDGVIAGIDPPA